MSAGCRIVHFMIHDRVSFGGALLAIGEVYAWLAAQHEAWAWWTLLVSNVAGFPSFFAYLGYGYFDTCHGAGTLALLPLCIGGLALSRPEQGSYRSLLRPALPLCWGCICLLATAIGMMGAGLTIMLVGMTCVFVPEDLAYMGLRVEDLNTLNPRLVPLIAHDRAGFGGAVFCCGVTLFFCLWCCHPPRSVLALVGGASFGTAIGIHPAIGYTDTFHLAPAVSRGRCLLCRACAHPANCRAPRSGKPNRRVV